MNIIQHSSWTLERTWLISNHYLGEGRSKTFKEGVGPDSNNETFEVPDYEEAVVLQSQCYSQGLDPHTQQCCNSWGDSLAV